MDVSPVRAFPRSTIHIWTRNYNGAGSSVWGIHSVQEKSTFVRSLRSKHFPSIVNTRFRWGFDFHRARIGESAKKCALTSILAQWQIENSSKSCIYRRETLASQANSNLALSRRRSGTNPETDEEEFRWLPIVMSLNKQTTGCLGGGGGGGGGGVLTYISYIGTFLYRFVEAAEPPYPNSCWVHNFGWFRVPSLKCGKTRIYVPFYCFEYGNALSSLKG